VVRPAIPRERIEAWAGNPRGFVTWLREITLGQREG
jgi:hypothetical protein